MDDIKSGSKIFSLSERTISRMIDHMSYGIHYVKANPYKKQINFPYCST